MKVVVFFFLVYQRFIPTNWARSFFHDQRIPDDWTKPAKALDWGTVTRVGKRVRDEMAELRAQGYPKKAESKTASK